MNFLDLLITEPHELASFHTLEKIDILIRRSSIDTVTANEILSHIKYEKDAIEFCNYLIANQLIPGFHYTPHTINEIGIAVRFMVDKDNLHELRWNTTRK